MTKKNIRHIAAFKSDQKLAAETASTLKTLFGKQDTAPVYSLGFQRVSKLTKAQYIALHVKFNFDAAAVKDALQTQTAKELLSA